jgi:hypothetical protein
MSAIPALTIDLISVLSDLISSLRLAFILPWLASFLAIIFFSVGFYFDQHLLHVFSVGFPMGDLLGLAWLGWFSFLLPWIS